MQDHLVPGNGIAGCPGDEQSSPSSSFTIATWNLERASSVARRNGAAGLMAQQDADIWILTETRRSLSPGPAYRLLASSGPRADAHRDECWVAIWTRIDGHAKQRPTSDDEFAACATLTPANRASIAVYGTVLPWRGSTWRGISSAGAAAYSAAIEAQAADWHGLVAETAQVCVAGDFNQDLADVPYYWSRGARAHLESALKECALEALTGGASDPVRVLTGGSAACIDHICVSGSLGRRVHTRPRAWAPTADNGRVSDHPGVIAKFV